MLKVKEDEIRKTSIFEKFISRPDSSAVVAVLALIIIFSFTSDNFSNMTNIFNVSRNASLYIFVALSQAIVLIIGDMNISLGSIGGLSVITCGLCMQNFGMPGIPAAFIAILIGCLAGFVNSMIITRFKLNAFVATLAMSFVYTGLVFGISKGQPYSRIAQGFTAIGRGSFLKMPILFWMMLAVLLFMYLFFKYMLTGRRILATGGNKEAARLSAIKTEKIIILCHVLSGLFAALAGVLWVSRMGSAPPGTGQDWMLISFAVAIIGGTALTGGVFTSLGMLCSALMIAIIKNGLVMLEVNQYFEQTFLGLIILLAVAVESIRQKYVFRIKL